VAGGHQVEIVDRNPAEAQHLADELGGGATALEPGAPFGGQVVVFAVYYPGIKDAVQQTADQLAGKVVVDITNPVDTQDLGQAGNTARDLLRRGGPAARRPRRRR
jgi:8-hydroxy-5-deazaflavin:NADPH oxidoreductase